MAQKAGEAWRQWEGRRRRGASRGHAGRQTSNGPADRLPIRQADWRTTERWADGPWIHRDGRTACNIRDRQMDGGTCGPTVRTAGRQACGRQANRRAGQRLGSERTVCGQEDRLADHVPTGGEADRDRSAYAEPLGPPLVHTAVALLGEHWHPPAAESRPQLEP